MMAVGEQSGRFAETMQMVADVYERELDQRIKIATAIIPPIIIVMIAMRRRRGGFQHHQRGVQRHAAGCQPHMNM